MNERKKKKGLPCGLAWANTVRGNICDSPHHQSWDRKNLTPSGFYAFEDHPSSCPLTHVHLPAS